MHNMQENKFIAAYQYLSSISTDGTVQYVRILEDTNKSKFKFIVDIDLNNYVVSITTPSGKIQKQDVREDTERAKKANEWYKKAKQAYDRFTNKHFFTPTYKE